MPGQRYFWGLVAALLVVQTASAELVVLRHDTEISARGDHFRLTVDLARGGEIVELELYDGAAWNRVLGADGQTCPAVKIQSPDGVFELARDGKAKILDYEADQDLLRFRVAAVPQAKDGRKAPWDVTLGYEIYAEGAVFVDLEYRCSQEGFPLTGASVGFAVDQTLTKAAKYRETLFTGRTVAVPSARIAFGLDKQKSFTNEIQVILETKKALAGEASAALALPGRFLWTLAGGQNRVGAGLRYQNRLALGLGAARARSNVIGHRIYHWINYLNLDRRADWYPSEAIIDKMVARHATTLILHQHWMLQGGSNGYPHADYAVPRDAESLRRMIDYAHRRQLRVGLYMRGIEPYALAAGFFPKYLRANWDGLYVDWHGPHSVAYHEKSRQPDPKLGDQHFSADGAMLPARAYFLFTRQLRQIVGPSGFLIGHMGPFNGGVLANLAFDGYLPGETSSDHDLFADRDTAVYKGMMGGVTCTPWTLDSAAYRTPEAVAKMAAWGLYPHVTLGIRRSKGLLIPLDPDEPINVFATPYWNILSAIDVSRATVHNLPSRRPAAATCSQPDCACLIYKETREKPERTRYLVIVANLSARPQSTSVRLATDVLGLSGTYRLASIDPQTGKSTPCGLACDTITTGPLPPWGMAGFVLEAGGK